MKILMLPITVLAHFDLTSTPHPLRFKLADQEHKIEQVVSVTEESWPAIKCCASGARVRSMES